ncbi:hypothetical protein PsorP6_000352 [Peronosclerospora sorghi]|uniref:Uncharacterized protein n=1 Tax=Peronosclerospora sorghi TaxID=230839 RepID=A0ACC0WW26_9STRA|nr:hypothetical protein PsorP6_000352 [Peronosclerospora sorghi]
MAASNSEDDNGIIPPAYNGCSDSSDNARNNPPACDDDSDISENAAMAAGSDSDSKSHSGDQLNSDSSEANNIEEIGYDSGQGDEEPNFPVDPIRVGNFAPSRIRWAKCMALGTIAHPQVDLQSLPPSQKEYPMLSSVNSFEWLSEGMGGTTPPLTMIKICGINPASLHDQSYNFLAPSILRRMRTMSCPRSYFWPVCLGRFWIEHWRKLSTPMEPYFGHALLRVASTAPIRLSMMGPYPVAFRFSSPAFSNTIINSYWVHLTERDLALRIIAPSIDMYPLKLGYIMGKAASALPHRLWLLGTNPPWGLLLCRP